MRLIARHTGGTVYEAPIPDQLRGHWCRLSLHLPRGNNQVLTRLRLESGSGPEALGEDVTLFPPPHPLARAHNGLLGGSEATGFNIWSILVATLGAIILLANYRLIARRAA